MANTSSTAAPDAGNHQQQHESLAEADVQVQAAETANESLSAAIPIPRDTDLEQGEDMAATLVNDESNDESDAMPPTRRWRGLAASLNLSAFSGEATWRHAQQDRNR